MILDLSNFDLLLPCWFTLNWVKLWLSLEKRGYVCFVYCIPSEYHAYKCRFCWCNHKTFYQVLNFPPNPVFVSKHLLNSLQNKCDFNKLILYFDSIIKLIANSHTNIINDPEIIELFKTKEVKIGTGPVTQKDCSICAQVWLHWPGDCT